jgi:hypothetical protein
MFTDHDSISTTLPATHHHHLHQFKSAPPFQLQSLQSSNSKSHSTTSTPHNQPVAFTCKYKQQQNQNSSPLIHKATLPSPSFLCPNQYFTSQSIITASKQFSHQFPSPQPSPHPNFTTITEASLPCCITTITVSIHPSIIFFPFLPFPNHFTIPFNSQSNQRCASNSWHPSITNHCSSSNPSLTPLLPRAHA